MVLFMGISSSLGRDELLARAKGLDVLMLDPKVLRSKESAVLAEELAGRSFANGSNISDQKRFEFLLWLSGRKDVSSAISETSFHSSSDILLVIFSGKRSRILHGLCASERPLNLGGCADAAEIERMSLSRV
ncbi:MAG: hypothetical protein ACP5NX_03195 [Candidatus Bilamarchaeaceae archaeon]